MSKPTQPLECVCRSCGHCFEVPLIGKCPACGSRMLARVQVSHVATGAQMGQRMSAPVLERLARFIRLRLTAQRNARSAEVRP